MYILTVVRFGINYDLGRRNSHMAGLDSGTSALILAPVFWSHLWYHKHGSFPETTRCGYNNSGRMQAFAIGDIFTFCIESFACPPKLVRRL